MVSPSGRDELQARALQRRGWRDEASLRRALEQARGSSEDLCGVLQRAKLLSPEDAAAARQSAERARVAAELRQILDDEPLFAAHAPFAFKPVSRLGVGGMGIVDRILDRRLRRDAALKTLKPGADADDLHRFQREARISARLTHPSVPAVYEAGITPDGEHYMLLQLVAGETLDTRIHRQEPSDPEVRRELLEILVKVSEAVAAAHSQGVVHRDLKPANIMIGEYGEVMVMDWGLARELKEEEDDPNLASHGLDTERILDSRGQTVTGLVLGTPGYMAPEQAEGRRVDIEADIFALGAILTEVLTGERPISAQEPYEAIRQTIAGEILTPRAIDPEVPKELDAIAARALEQDWQRRMASAAIFASNLKAWLSGREVSAYHYTPLERRVRWLRAHSSQLIVALSFAYLVGFAGLLWWGWRRSEERVVTSEEHLAAESRERRWLELERDVYAGAEEAREALAARLERLQGELSDPARASPLWLRLGRVDLAAATAGEAATPGDLQAHLAWHKVILSGGAALRDDSAALQGLRRAPLEPWLEITLKALTAWRTGDDDAAARGLERALTARPEAWLPAYALAELRLTSGRPELAEALLEPHLASPKAGLLERRLEGAVALARRRPERALRCAQVVLSCLPEDPGAQRLSALALADLGRPEPAFAILDELERRRPQDMQLLRDHARILIGTRRFAEAEERLERALNVEPKSAEGFVLMAELARRRGDRAAALRWLEQASATDPRDAEPHALLAAVAVDRGALNEALKHLDRAIEIAPWHVRARCIRADIFLQRGEPGEAAKDIDAARRIDPDDITVATLGAHLEIAERRYDEALTTCRRLVARDAMSHRIWGLMSVAHRWLGQLEEALECAQRAVQCSPLTPNESTNLGLTCQQCGRHDEAVHAFTRALALAGPPAPNLMARATSFEALGMIKDARRDLMRIIEDDASSPLGQQARAMLARLEADRERE